MHFFKCSVAGETYETGVTKIEVEVANAKEVQRPTKARDTCFNFVNARLMSGAWRNEPNPDMFKCFVARETYETGVTKIEVEVANAEEVQQPTKARDTGFNFDDARLMFSAWRNEPNPDMFKDFAQFPWFWSIKITWRFRLDRFAGYYEVGIAGVFDGLGELLKPNSVSGLMEWYHVVLFISANASTPYHNHVVHHHSIISAMSTTKSRCSSQRPLGKTQHISGTGGQFELTGDPLETLHQTFAKVNLHL
ncbi:phospholipid-transporting ATPase 3-like protein [Tanacetum coccineum]